MELLPKTDDQLLPEVIAPQEQLIADTYLTNGLDAIKTSEILNIDKQRVLQVLDSPVIKSYTTRVFYEGGYRNKGRFFGVLDEIINRKLEEMEESGIGSELDIIDIMSKYHKMKMEQLQMEIKLEEIKNASGSIKQTNTQNNTVIAVGDSNMQQLMQRLMTGKGVK
jgi:hypothetical protein